MRSPASWSSLATTRLDPVMENLVVMLSRLVKHVGKVTCSDALTNDATFELLKHREGTHTLMWRSQYHKFEGAPAVRA